MHWQYLLGFLEKAENKIYSSQLTIGADGNILNLFRRVSKGWRESFTDEHYAEGDMFTKFEYLGNTFSIGLCGDLWDEKNVMQIKNFVRCGTLACIHRFFGERMEQGNEV